MRKNLDFSSIKTMQLPAHPIRSLILILLTLMSCFLLGIEVIAAQKTQKLSVPDHIFNGPSSTQFAISKGGEKLSHISNLAPLEEEKEIYPSNIYAYISNFADPKIRLRYEDSVAALLSIEKELGRRLFQSDPVTFYRTERHIHNFPAVTMMFRNIKTLSYEETKAQLLPNEDIYLVIPLEDIDNLKSNHVVKRLDVKSEHMTVLKVLSESAIHK